MATGLSWQRSAALYRRAQTLLPGGVSSPVRALAAIGRDPIFFVSGDGAELCDADGNRYIDWVCSWGPLIAGHAHPHVLAAIGDAAAQGTSFGACNERELLLAEAVRERMPAIELLRFTSSGTEAAMSALRLARAATGRELIVKFAGAYHGHSDGLLAEAGSGMATAGLPASAGVPAAFAAATIVLPWNDRRALEQLAGRRDIAAIIAEPLPANMGLVPAEAGYLEALRDAAGECGALLIADEVISGFRVAAGGAQELLGIEPDLVVLGKVLGGGLPAAAFGGSAELMRMLAPCGAVYQAGTLSGNPLAMAAGLATLELLDAPAYAELERKTEALANGLRDAAGDRPVQVQSRPGMLTLFFSARPISDLAGAQRCDLAAHGQFCRALIERGVYPPPSQFEAWFPSLAHSDEQIARTIEAAAAAFQTLAPAGAAAA